MKRLNPKSVKRSRGFSLAEVLLVVGLFSVAAALSVDALRNGSRRQPVRSIGQVLAERFAAARGRALATGAPVAMVFPQGSLHNSLQMVEGDDLARVTSSYRWDNDFPGAQCFVGRWTLDGGKAWSLDASLPTTWTQFSSQTVVGYSGNGTLFSNAPVFDRAVHLVIGPAFGASGSQLDSALTPWTLDLDKGGHISLHSGLTAGSSLPERGGGVVSVSSPLPLPGQTNRGPHLDSLLPVPVADPSTLPSGFDATVSSDGYLTFEGRATDPDGGPLHCAWTSSGGSFSSQSPSRCDWDPILKQWVSRWTFAPPPDAVAGSSYDLTCTFLDSNENPQSSGVRASLKLKVIKRQKIAYVSNRRYVLGSVNSMDLFTSNTDGTEVKLVREDGQLLIAPRWSPDGSTVVYSRTTGQWSDNSVNFSLDSVLRDGSQHQVLLPAPANWTNGVKTSAFTIDGTGIWAMGTTPTGSELWKVLLDGTATTPGTVATRISSGFPFNSTQCSYNSMTVHPITGHLLIADTAGKFHYFDPQNSLEYTFTQPTLPPGGGRLIEPAISPDGLRLLYSCVPPSAPLGSARRQIFVADLSVDAAAHTASISSSTLLFSDDNESPSFGTDPDTLYFQKQVSATQRKLMRYQFQSQKSSTLSIGANNFEDDGCVTIYPEIY